MSALLRLVLKARRAYVRAKIAWARQDVDITQAEIAALPVRLATYQQHVRRLQLEEAVLDVQILGS